MFKGCQHQLVKAGPDLTTTGYISRRKRTINVISRYTRSLFDGGFLWDLVCYPRSLDHVTPGVGPWPPDCIAAYQILDGLVGCRTPAAVHSPPRSIQDFCCRGHPSSCMDT
ncbi:hypothetical protein NQ317_016812 [Molorchus minor]|uniref:Uncharacterized protein n=1 Tax=Molorchus minor TaxID=1323400 RepID=A0ABQ9JFZ7_9CUCU|nr:hypothetical protein NQ317_016812 [Molorchus minor]